jgi:indolepyruvate ferredoxin oxidoreductase beta subunit
MNILLTGVGGQGTVLAARLIGETAIAKGLPVRGSETIGMAQRGGSVTSQIRIGDGAYSPLVHHGMVDLLIGFEAAEAVRASPYLKADGTMVVCDKQVESSIPGNSYNKAEMLDWLRTNIKQCYILESEKLTSERTLNVALLGVAIAHNLLPFTFEEMEASIRKRVKPEFVERNLKALKTAEAQSSQR